LKKLLLVFSPVKHESAESFSADRSSHFLASDLGCA
jgi:hypothetical protein